MVTLGYMPMPANFPYMDVAQKGRPQHKGWDSFTIKHPPMPAARWAKIFSPFDALKGFSDAVAAKETQYEYKRELMENDAAELDRKLERLHNLTWNGRMARQNKVNATICYFVPCKDRENFAYGNAGTYETITGMVLRVDVDVEKTITLLTDAGKKVISFDDIAEIIVKESQI